MKKQSLVLGLLGVLVLAGVVAAHCEIPCGIFDDKMRIVSIREDLTTIEKSMRKIVELSAADEPDMNQIVRWVTNKEEHAEELQHVVSQYFLHQRIKPAGAEDAAYVKQLTLLHEILVSAMKSKQSTDTAHTAKLRELITEFAEAYFGPEDLEHLRQHGHGR